ASTFLSNQTENVPQNSSVATDELLLTVLDLPSVTIRSAVSRFSDPKSYIIEKGNFDNTENSRDKNGKTMSFGGNGEMESLDLPECPVCLQNYDGEYTIPRVLACGHSACEACLVRLPKRYPETIRCPACTQLVKYPPLGPTALPKNIDLLSFSLSLNPNPNSRSSQNPQKQSTDGVCKFLPRIWSDEFYDTWKEWVLPSDALSVETEVGDVTRDGLCTVLKGRTGSGSGFGLGSGRVWFREDQSVSFVQVGSLPNLGSSGFEFSYIARVMKCLSGMREGERNELGLLLRASVRQCRKVGKVYGLWGNSEDGFLYVVCERRNGSFSEKLNELRDGDGFGKDGLSAFAMIAMEVCEAVTGLHSEGFASGCFGVSCFGFDDFGHVFVDLSEVLVTGKKAWRSVVDSVSGTMEIDAEVLGVTFGKLLKDDVFVSPEVLFEALQKEGIAVECDSSRYLVGYGSDVCSLACVLVRLLLGKEFSEEIVKTSENLFRDHSTYASWIERVSALLEIKFGSEYASLKENLCNCLNFNPESRPLMIDVMKCIRELIIKPQCDITAGLDGAVKDESANCCLILGELCQIPKQISETQKENELQGSKVSGGADFDQVGDERTNNGVVDGLAEGKVKSKVMQGHRDSITGLAVGGHEHAIKALIYVDEEQPLCISGDSGGGIFIWGACTPLGQEPLKILYEEKDWRFSGIHALASRNGYVYTGSGDRTVKAWSVRDGTLSCTMSGHRSVVSTLAVCDGVLYSGSWDGTIRLWSLSDHSPLTVLEEDASGTVTSVLSLVVDRHLLIATHENGCVKVWRNDVFMKSIKMHNGAELSGDEIQIDYRPVGFIPCDSVITTLLSWQGKLFVGHANRNITRRLRLTRTPISASLKLGCSDYYRLVSSVNSLEPQIQRLTDDQLTAKTAEFRQRLWKGETLADIQAEAFAVVREAAKRKLGMRHFDVQIIGGAVLHDGSIAEMKTGEGKTLVSTLAAYLNALTGEGVHVVTVNDYLAQRDAEWMGRVHRLLGLTVGLVQRGMTAEERRSNYSCDITYTNNSELGFDYLRDNLAGSSGQLVMRWPKPFHFAIVDEVDSVLIDEGRNPLLISGEASKDAARYPVAAKVADLLVRDIHYKVELKDNSVELTEEGIALAEMALETNDLWDENDPWARFVMNALKAKEFYRQDVQYIVRNGKALIINELTGRVEEKRRWSEGIHQAVEAKEGLKIQADSVVVAQITYQSLFKLYPKLSGMTGTAKTEEKEFLKMFQVPVIEVPTNLPNIRNDLPIQAFATAQGKWEYVRQEVEYMFRQGRPVLVGSTSVENSEYLSDLLKEQNIPHNVLNARPKYAAREAEIVAQAGRKYAITISTNMAGRGTDIILGGNPKMLAKEIIEDSLISFLTREAPNVDVDGEAISQKVLSKIKVGPSSLAFLAKTALMAKYVSKNEGKSWTYKEAKSMISESVEMSQSRDSKELERLVDEQWRCTLLALQLHLLICHKKAWGLHVIGTSLHESRRIDNQLRGRAGRQGDPGSTRFMVSLQDEMFQKFNFDTEWAVRLISKLQMMKICQLKLLALQINAEKYFFGIRKSLVEFDEVLEVQRKHVYELRQSILTGDNESCSQHIFQYMQAVVDEIVFANVNALKHPRNWSLGKLLKEFMTISGKLLDGITEEALLKSLAHSHELNSIDLDDIHLPNLPRPPKAFRGIRKKSSSLKRWLAICSDDLTKNGRYHAATSLLRKYLGDFLIVSYLDVIEESGYDDAYVKEVERAVLVKTLDCFWRDHLVNMNRLSSAVNVRSFGHRNPLEEYKIDGCRFFISMLSATRRLTVESLLQYWSSPIESQEIFLS
ncbi:Preprotein translocase SecA family protein, partial [Prunus dulcis]